MDCTFEFKKNWNKKFIWIDSSVANKEKNLN